MNPEILEQAQKELMDWYRYCSLLYISPRNVQQKKLRALVDSPEGNLNTIDNIKELFDYLVEKRVARIINKKDYLVEVL